MAEESRCIVVCSCGSTTVLHWPRRGKVWVENDLWQYDPGTAGDDEPDNARLWNCGEEGHCQAGLLQIRDPEGESPFKPGDAVWAPNGEPRIVTGAAWDHSQPVMQPGSYPRVIWAWFVKTVHPDDPACIGQGIASMYAPRAVGPSHAPQA